MASFCQPLFSPDSPSRLPFSAPSFSSLPAPLAPGGTLWVGLYGAWLTSNQLHARNWREERMGVSPPPLLHDACNWPATRSPVSILLPINMQTGSLCTQWAIWRPSEYPGHNFCFLYNQKSVVQNPQHSQIATLGCKKLGNAGNLGQSQDFSTITPSLWLA